MSESKVEKEVCKYAKKYGWRCVKFTSPNLRGVPDRMFLRSGIAMFIEFKDEGEEPSKQQVKRMSELSAMGFQCFCIDSIIEGEKLFDRIEMMKIIVQICKI